MPEARAIAGRWRTSSEVSKPPLRLCKLLILGRLRFAKGVRRPGLQVKSLFHLSLNAVHGDQRPDVENPPCPHVEESSRVSSWHEGRHLTPFAASP